MIQGKVISIRKWVYLKAVFSGIFKMKM